MANYYTRFACTLPIGNDDARQQALLLHDKYCTELEEADGSIDFELQVECAADVYGLIFTSVDGSGDPDQIAALVGRIGPALGLTGRWGFVWAYTCDRDRLDGFGGGAVVVNLETGEVAASLDCARWLSDTLGSLGGAGA